MLPVNKSMKQLVFPFVQPSVFLAVVSLRNGGGGRMRVLEKVYYRQTSKIFTGENLSWPLDFPL